MSEEKYLYMIVSWEDGRWNPLPTGYGGLTPVFYTLKDAGEALESYSSDYHHLKAKSQIVCVPMPAPPGDETPKP